MREFWAVKRFSVKCPPIVLLKGMAKKFVPPALPVLVVRNMEVKSINPPGVKSAPPMRNESGDSLRSVSCTGALETGWAAEVDAAAVVMLALTRRGALVLSALSADAACDWP